MTYLIAVLAAVVFVGAYATGIGYIKHFAFAGADAGQPPPGTTCRVVELQPWDGKNRNAITNRVQGGVHEIVCRGKMWMLF